METKIKNFNFKNIEVFNKYLFEMKAVVCHKGTVNKGHYTCQINRGQIWFELSDDSKYECLNPAQSNLRNACYLILEKKGKSKNNS